jgi:hypothetical protein
MEATRINGDEDVRKAGKTTDARWKCFWNFETEK